MSVKKKDGVVRITDADAVTVTWLGNHARVCKSPMVGCMPVVYKVNKDLYCDYRTGEVFDYDHTRTRADDARSMRRTCQRLMDIFNANFTWDKCARIWIVTLTYAQNQTDGNKAWDDWTAYFRAFAKKLKRAGIDRPEYIAVAEPQGRGAWHFHVYFLWPSEPPRIDFKAYFYDLWGKGYVRVVNHVRCKEGSNLGAYFGSYFSDIPLEDVPADVDITDCTIKSCEIDGKSKKIVKNGRFKLYPAGMNYYRTSRGIVRPVVDRMSYRDAKSAVIDKGGSLSYASAFRVDVSDWSFDVAFEYFSGLR